MWKRLAAARLSALARRFPVVCILGARQVGKTTLARATFRGGTYLDLERPSDLDRLRIDPEMLLERAAGPVVLDEAQVWPPVFPVLRSLVDESPRRNGRFVVVGSAQPALVRGASESLAGRVGFLDLDPLSVAEVAAGAPRVTIDSLWLRGGFPGALHARGLPAWRDWMEGFARTFVERDVGALGLEVSAPRMRQLWGMLAHLHGGIFNASELGASLGTSYHTVQRYVDILERCFLVRRLAPYHRNVGKRLVRSPRLFLRDTGLLHYFLGVRRAEQLEHEPRRGASWEGFVIEQIIRRERLERPESQFWFWRTATGMEVDLLVDRAGDLVPVEIKLARRVADSDLKGLRSCMTDLGLRRGVLLAEVDRPFAAGKGIEVLPVREALAARRFRLGSAG